MSLELAKRSVPHRFAEFEGDHEWLPAVVAVEALDFFTGRIPPLAAQASKEQEKQAARFQSLFGQIASASDSEKRSLLHKLQSDAAKPADGGDRRVARRVIGSVFVEAMEESRQLMTDHQYAASARLWETAVLARPKAGGAWYSLAVAQAAAGNSHRALEALEQATENGFRDRQRIEQEPFFTRLQNDPRYKGVLQKLQQ